jgi:hypothetical protein
MATTDAKPGFRLPWSADRGESEAPAETAGDAPIGEALTTDQENETPDMIDAAPAAPDHMAAVDDQSAVSETTAEGNQPSDSASDAASSSDAPASSGKSAKPNKFMADLTKAMQGAAETAKADTLARFTADAKGHIEAIHASTAVEAGELRKQADDDVASIREWSKAEIARIREETDERITHRKARLEREIDAHAAEIEGRIERVQRRVDAFEAEMAAFFERLLAEEDATRFAAMAQSLPEPPPFDTETAEDRHTAEAAVAEAAVADANVAESDDLPAERAVVVEPWPETPAEAATETVDAPEAGTTDETDASAEAVAEPEVEAPATTDDQPATEEAETEAVATEGEPEAEASEASDPRLDALGFSPDFAAAEAEAAAFTPEEGPAEEITVIADDALAARLAGLVPDADAPASESHTTRVVVTGLVSVASIAGFKRQLSRASGVQSVGVSAGPDGEFLFSVAHDSAIVLKDAVTTLPGFGARVTAEAEGELTVTAKDPEAEG